MASLLVPVARFATAPLSPILHLIPFQPPPVVVPPSQPLRQVDSVIAQRPKSPTIFPLISQEAQTTRTYSFFNGDPARDRAKDELSSWTLSLLVEIPSNLINPNLKSLVYFVKYATTHDNGNSTVQTDVVLSTRPHTQGKSVWRILSDLNELGIYRNSQARYGARMVDEDLALPLSTVPAVKCNGGNGQWSHYVDAQRLFPDVRIIDRAGTSLYLNFHVDEYPTVQTSRCLDVQVSASWVEDLEARKAEEERNRKPQAPSVKDAPPVADDTMQLVIEEAAKAHGAACPSGFAWVKTIWGYQCSAGGHKLTFEQLGMK